MWCPCRCWKGKTPPHGCLSSNEGYSIRRDDRFTMSEYWRPDQLPDLSSARVVAIDGDNGAGKTKLAEAIQLQFSMARFSLDDYLAENGEPFLNQINYCKLIDDLKNSPRPLIIEGVCCVQVLEKVKMDYDCLIVATDSRSDSPSEVFSRSKTWLPKNKLTREIVKHYRKTGVLSQANYVCSDFVITSVNSTGP